MRGLREWHPGRRAALVALVGLPFLGAAVGASLNPSSTFGYEAESRLVVDLGAPDIAGDVVRRDARLNLLAEAARSEAVLGAVADARSRTLELADLKDRVDVELRRESGTVLITASDRTDDDAASLANSVGLQALAFLRTAVPDPERGGVPLGDFELGVEGWAIDSRFSALPRSIGVDTGNPRYNQSSLRAECGPARGCGPATLVRYPFQTGRRYVASGWARADRRTPLSIVFGASPDDVISSEPRTVGRRWRRLSVSWQPASDTATAEVGFQTQRTGTVALNVDGVLLIDPATTPVERLDAALPFRREAASLREGRFAGFVPAARGDEVENDTARAAGLGALGGLAVALAGVGGGALARRRPQQHREHQA